MKKLIFCLALLPIGLLLIAFAPAATRVQFAQTDWDNSKRQAVKEGKLFFVDFDASYCATCRNMDQGTYMDQALSDYINENVVAHRVDVQDFDGVMWSQTYEVDALPTMLVFDSKGKLIQRLVGYKSASDLLRVFKETREKEALSSITTNTDTKMQDEVPMITTTVVTAPTVTQANSITTTTPSNTTTNTTTITTNNTVKPEIKNPDLFLSEQPSEVPSGLGLFEITARKQESKGFAVQIGVFNSYENVLNKAAELREEFAGQRIILHADKLNGEVAYKLLIGVFNSRREATTFTLVLKQKNIDSIVKDLVLMQ